MADAGALREMLLSAFDRIYVINLPHRADRRQEMAAQFARVGLSFEHPAVTLFPAAQFDDPGGFPSLGARGCFHSHLRILKAHLAGPDARALVLEDDADFAPDFGSVFPAMVPALREMPWNFLPSVSDMPESCPPLAGPAGAGLLCQVPPDMGLRCTHFLGIDRAFADRAVPYLEAILTRAPGDPLGGPMHVDGAFSHLRRDMPDLNVIAPRQMLSRQRVSRSDIADLRLFDRVPGLRELAGVARRMKRRLRA